MLLGRVLLHAELRRACTCTRLVCHSHTRAYACSRRSCTRVVKDRTPSGDGSADVRRHFAVRPVPFRESTILPWLEELIAPNEIRGSCFRASACHAERFAEGPRRDTRHTVSVTSILTRSRGIIGPAGDGRATKRQRKPRRGYNRSRLVRGISAEPDSRRIGLGSRV